MCYQNKSSAATWCFLEFNTLPFWTCPYITHFLFQHLLDQRPDGTIDSFGCWYERDYLKLKLHLKGQFHLALKRPHPVPSYLLHLGFSYLRRYTILHKPLWLHNGPSLFSFIGSLWKKMKSKNQWQRPSGWTTQAGFWFCHNGNG